MVLAEASGRAEVGKAEEVGPSLMAHTPPQGLQPRRGQARLSLPSRLSLTYLVSLSPCFSFSRFSSASPSSTPSFYVPLYLPRHLPDSPLLSLFLCLSPVATVNDLACRGLDKLEEKLPFLQQPSEMVQHQTVGTCTGWEWEGGRRPPPRPSLNPSASRTLGPGQALVTSKNTSQMKIIGTHIY